MRNELYKVEVYDGILRIVADTACPNCEERYFYYIDSDKSERGILPSEYIFEGFFDYHYGKSYDCYTCGHSWKIRKSKKNRLVRIFPFLENH